MMLTMYSSLAAAQTRTNAVSSHPDAFQGVRAVGGMTSASSTVGSTASSSSSSSTHGPEVAGSYVTS